MATDATTGTEATPDEQTGGLEVRQKALQEELRELIDVVGPAPLVDLLLERAFQLNATDIHIDPNQNGLRVRLRVDGMLHDVMQLPQKLTAQVVSRLKIMAGMDITERRAAQDGHISKSVIKHQRDIRVGPTTRHSPVSKNLASNPNNLKRSNALLIFRTACSCLSVPSDQEKARPSTAL
jgi:type II secretory ATPase GspE/PulE/Tfp pilus assembly ATPase PilB-like protein